MIRKFMLLGLSILLILTPYTSAFASVEEEVDLLDSNEIEYKPSVNDEVDPVTGDKIEDEINDEMDESEQEEHYFDNNSTENSEIVEEQDATNLSTDSITKKEPSSNIVIFSNVLKRGDKNPAVKQLKLDLARIGFVVSQNPNNRFGPSTEQKVKEFQAYYSLTTDGMVGPITRNMINSILNNPLQKGKSNNETITLKQSLMILGYGDFKGNNIFGPSTERALKEFQRDYGLIVNGIGDPVTLNKLERLMKEVENPGELKRGDNHPAVRQLKLDLARIGFVVSQNPNNRFGPSTEEKVREFQGYYGLKVDGIAGSSTFSMIDTILNSPLQRGKRTEETITLKQSLMSLKYGDFEGNEIFGPSTERALKAFQVDHGLIVNGIGDPVTLNKLEQLLIELENPSELKRGDNHPAVKQLKLDLARIGFVVSQNPNNQFGPTTEQKVKQFQAYYGLVSDGIVGPATFGKINSILNSPLQRGGQSPEVITLKKSLMILGYGDFVGNENFGPSTEKALKQFQRDHGLVVNGIGDPITLNKLNYLVENREIVTYMNLNITLNEALNIQMSKYPQTDKYRNSPAYISADFVNLTQHAAIYSTGNVNLRTEPIIDPANIVTSVPNGTRIEVLDEVEGTAVNGNTKWYKIEYGKYKELYVHSGLVKLNSLTATTTANLNVRSQPTANSHSYGLLTKGTIVTVQEEVGNWYRINYQTWRNATRSDVEAYLNPNNNNRFQHLLLSSSVGVSASEINKILKGQGILNGLGQAFIDGGRTHKVNEIYLISHAFLETGRGTSQLATGVEVGKNKSGNLELVTSSNRRNLTDIKTTYNMFGIGAVDNNALAGGAFRAYREGWFTPEAAIKGGAKFVGQNYIHSSHKQDTLYKMRWNPANPGTHQYATDMAWAVKQVAMIEELYNQLTNPILHFDIPVYK